MDMTAAGIVRNGEAFLGIELGSTRIKAVLIDAKCNVIAQGVMRGRIILMDGIGPIIRMRSGAACAVHIRISDSVWKSDTEYPFSMLQRWELAE